MPSVPQLVFLPLRVETSGILNLGVERDEEPAGWEGRGAWRMGVCRKVLEGFLVSSRKYNPLNIYLIHIYIYAFMSVCALKPEEGVRGP